jgi:FMN phosphatase YigB (HAD superfamily)
MHAEIAGPDPTRCYFVDDTEVNVAAARELGLQTHRFRNTARLVAALAWTGLGDPG